MSDKIKIVIEPSEDSRVRDVCAKIAAIEAHYWAETSDERIALMAMGAMGAAANICCAILRERTPEQHEADCNARDKQWEKPADV